METRIFLLADFANVDAAGKLNIIGAFNRIYVEKLPGGAPVIYLVGKVAAGLGEFGKERTYRVILFDEDGNELGNVGGKFKFLQPDAHDITSEWNLVLAFMGVAFAKEGRYEFRLLINDAIAGVAPLDIVLRQPAPQE